MTLGMLYEVTRGEKNKNGTSVDKGSGSWLGLAGSDEGEKWRALGSIWKQSWPDRMSWLRGVERKQSTVSPKILARVPGWMCLRVELMILITESSDNRVYLMILVWNIWVICCLIMLLWMSLYASHWVNILSLG